MAEARGSSPLGSTLLFCLGRRSTYVREESGDSPAALLTVTEPRTSTTPSAPLEKGCIRPYQLDWYGTTMATFRTHLDQPYCGAVARPTDSTEVHSACGPYVTPRLTRPPRISCSRDVNSWASV